MDLSEPPFVIPIFFLTLVRHDDKWSHRQDHGITDTGFHLNLLLNVILARGR